MFASPIRLKRQPELGNRPGPYRTRAQRERAVRVAAIRELEDLLRLQRINLLPKLVVPAEKAGLLRMERGLGRSHVWTITRDEPLTRLLNFSTIEEDTDFTPHNGCQFVISHTSAEVLCDRLWRHCKLNRHRVGTSRGR